MGTPQAFGQRLKTGKIRSDDLNKIAAAMGAEFINHFRLKDA